MLGHPPKAVGARAASEQAAHHLNSSQEKSCFMTSHVHVSADTVQRLICDVGGTA